MSASDPFACALRLLAVRGRSEAELAGRLRRKGFAEPAVAAALARCRELGYLDDERFARERARELMGSGRAVGCRLLSELKRRGLAEAVAREALAAAGQDCDERALLAGLRRRRFAGFCWQQADDRERRRVVDFFRRRGFPLPLILSSLQEERYPDTP